MVFTQCRQYAYFVRNKRYVSGRSGGFGAGTFKQTS